MNEKEGRRRVPAAAVQHGERLDLRFRSAIMIMRNIYLVAILLCVIIGGCSENTRGISQETITHSKHYKEKGLYEDLKWLAENCLRVGMDREEVEIIFGSDNEPYVGDLEFEALYSSKREVPWGHLFLITYEDKKVKLWEWVDE